MEEPPSGEINLKLFEANETGFAGLFNFNQWAHFPNEKLKDKALYRMPFFRQLHEVTLVDNHLISTSSLVNKISTIYKGSCNKKFSCKIEI